VGLGRRSSLVYPLRIWLPHSSAVPVLQLPVCTRFGLTGGQSTGNMTSQVLVKPIALLELSWKHREVCHTASRCIYPRELGDVFAFRPIERTESASIRVEEVAVSKRSVTMVAVVLYLRIVSMQYVVYLLVMTSDWENEGGKRKRNKNKIKTQVTRAEDAEKKKSHTTCQYCSKS
jgi:hypothetical protein